MVRKMTKYIDTDQLEAFCFTDREGSFSDGVQWLLEYIDSLPAVYVNIHGHWIDHISEIFPADSTVECSVCHEHVSALLGNLKYCPNCGAKMDEYINKDTER